MKRSASQDAQAQPGGAIGDRFGQIFAQRLAAVGLDAREWLMLPPSAEALESTDPAVFVSIDPRRDPARWERLYAPGRHAPAPDFMGQALPFAQERFAAVLIGGLGSHLLPGRHFHEFMLAYNTDPPWIFSLDYGSTFSPNAPCAERAAAALRAILDRPECRGKQALLICHSKGAALAHILLAEARFADLHPRIWGVAAFAGAIGGSPHAESALAHAARATRDKTPDWIAHGLAAALRALGVAIPHSLIRAAPTLGELPDALPDLARDARQAYLRSHPLPVDKWFFSVAGAIEPDRLRAA